jgi:hypothetical protein
MPCLGPNIPPVPPTSDWRVGLCVTSGCTDMPKDILIYSESTLQEQLDARCTAILTEQMKIDTNPPSLLYNLPSIILPRALASIVLPAFSTAQMSPASHSSAHISAEAPNTSVCGSISPLSTNAIATQEDATLWLPLLQKYVTGATSDALKELLAQKNKIYVFFAVPNYSSFSYLQLEASSSVVATMESARNSSIDSSPIVNPEPVSSWSSVIDYSPSAVTTDDISVKTGQADVLHPLPSRSVSSEASFSSPQRTFMKTGILERLEDEEEKGSEEMLDSRVKFDSSVTTRPPKPPMPTRKSKTKVDIDKLRAVLTSEGEEGAPGANAVAQEEEAPPALASEELQTKTRKRSIFSWKSSKSK